MRTLFNAGIAACMVTLQLLYPIIANARTVRDAPARRQQEREKAGL